ncbi:MAG TPA: hypothetical protein VJX70_13775 [Candidatus Acidoferrum sp.]|nr:hypothetical protein [Candidatus Acidoferrum sp.]
MDDPRLPRILYVVLLLVGLVRMAYYYPQMPQRISAMMGWFGCGLLFVLISGTFLALRANLAPDGRFNLRATLAVLGGFLIGLFLSFFRFVRHFQRAVPSA